MTTVTEIKKAVLSLPNKDFKMHPALILTNPLNTLQLTYMIM